MTCEHCTFQVLSSTNEEQIEVCTSCGKKKRYRFVKGKINNNEYLKDHARDFAQPGGASDKMFRRYYGTPKPLKRSNAK